MWTIKYICVNLCMLKLCDDHNTSTRVSPALRLLLRERSDLGLSCLQNKSTFMYRSEHLKLSHFKISFVTMVYSDTDKNKCRKELTKMSTKVTSCKEMQEIVHRT